MKTINQFSVERAIEAGAVKEVTVYRVHDKRWYFTFDAKDPKTGQVTTYSLETQRGSLRCWADPRKLFDFLRERGIFVGRFNLSEDDT
ncbi:KorA family transcriptional regulator [Brucella cytisi]|uniref:KorA protein n=1 Tax=Brucella cytisi TaxID=407152 RepID=A0A1J6HB20_9HYPH|nr:KorA family transcriptional regulator [Brucella cytisi]OIS90308.1 KorA protein [Brucella cytisi]